MFNISDKFMNFMNKIVDMIVLNVMTILAFIPIITIGAAKTSLIYILDKIRKDEEGYVTKMFIDRIRADFKVSTRIWLFFLIFGGLFGVDVYVMYLLDFGNLSYIAMAFFLIVFVLITMTEFVALGLSARFENTVRGHLRNGFFIALGRFPSVFFMIILELLPFILVFAYPASIMGVVVFYSMIGISLTTYIELKIYDNLFYKYEKRQS